MQTNILAAFRMPTPVKITGRTSTITNAFVNGIIPVFPPTEAEIVQALEVLGMSVDNVQCAYCGGLATEWDHLRPLVKSQRPTGYISEIANLVPACGKCNQSKSGSDWRSWINGNARLCPKTRSIPDIADRIARLEAYERWREPRKIDFVSAAGQELWDEHWKNHERLLTLMREYEQTAQQIRLAVRAAVSS
jgi:hypothetical protein